MPGPFRQAQSLVERSSAAVDREHVENQVLARAFGLVRKRADDPGTDAPALVAGIDLDAGQIDLPGR